MSNPTDAKHHIRQKSLRPKNLVQRLDRVNRLGHNALRGQDLPGPVVLLPGIIFAHYTIARMLAVPQHAAIEVLRVRMELPAAKVAAHVVAEVVMERGLDGPLANENRVSGCGVGLCELAGAVDGVLRVRAVDEEVDVRVDDDVGVDFGPVWLPCLRADEAVEDGYG